MKKKLLYALIITPILIISFINYSYSRKGFAPTGYVGAVGENSCGSGTTGCHFQTSTNCGSLVGVLGSLNDDLVLKIGGNVIDENFEYQPDSTYEMVFEILNPTANGGFSLTSLDANEVFQGALATTDSNAEVLSNAVNTVDYVGHTNVLGIFQWSFSWTAPSFGTGDITFYASANKANGAVGQAPINSCGDTIVPFKLTISEADTVNTTGLNSVSLLNDVFILNNPILNNHIVIETFVKEPKKYFISVYDLSGKQIHYSEKVFHVGLKNIEIPFSQKGVFILNITTNQNEFANYKILN